MPRSSAAGCAAAVLTCLEYDLETSSLAVFMNKRNHLGAESKIDEVRYLPCSFDLRYKAFNSGKSFGMRTWLEDT